MSDDLKALKDLIDLGGNSALMIGVYLGWQVLKAIREVIERNTRGFYALQRAIAACSPAAARIIEEHERSEDARLQSKGP